MLDVGETIGVESEIDEVELLERESEFDGVEPCYTPPN
jgi:hypothetical protein